MTDHLKAADYFKCRYCDFITPKYRRLKGDGKYGHKFRSGWNILNAHIEVAHPDNYEQLLEWWERHRSEEWDIAGE